MSAVEVDDFKCAGGFVAPAGKAGLIGGEILFTCKHSGGAGQSNSRAVEVLVEQMQVGAQRGQGDLPDVRVRQAR